ncbi:FAD-dependent oxidoreductase [Crenobacter caeni]|uniref:D-amino-acid oxidase n=1 Tax=Crenobacter caeni TaxID=2705474 RepID=A0A6B2KUE2_9NEIS|nr:FAD-dependent oxidoreductase [Crenobacter caeni]NDV13724.1 FAD-dependent oxidoreductase [Crenobacter caeni]
MARVAIAGAGVVGRLLAWTLSRRGHAVTVFDPAPGAGPAADGKGAAGFTAAGMLSPLAELEHAPPEIARLGLRSLGLWRQIAAELSQATGEAACAFARFDDSLLLAHPGDGGAAARVLARLALAPDIGAPEALNTQALAALEPSLAPGLNGWRLAGEGQVFPQRVLPALAEACPASWRWGERVESVGPGCVLTVSGERCACDLAIDARGVGAALANLRGVRGEVLWLYAPGVALNRPLRLMHARHRVYVVPRPGDVVVVGASEIESADRSPVSVRTAFELMGAAVSAIPALAEARVLHMETNLRPALPDNLPRVELTDGLLRVGGLFRHGWLIAPALIEDALAAAALH